MNELEIKNIIKAYKADREDLQRQIDQIDNILDRHYYQLSRLEKKE